jgi:DNA-binding beta-propeller fold protein YncE
MCKSNYLSAIIAITLFCVGCKESQKSWVFKSNIQLDGIKPLGIVVGDTEMWLSDVDNNRLVKTNLIGEVLEVFPDLQRPMHISMANDRLYIPEFLDDTVTVIAKETRSEMKLDFELEGPAGIDVEGNTIAIIDFYNHRLMLNQSGKSSVIGKKGHADGEFNYPTDVELFDDRIFVADAYNNRVQVFDYDGNMTQVIGWQEGIQVASGVAVTSDRVYVTDFHGSRILIYDFYGTLIKVFDQGFDKPTDIYVTGTEMYVANYGGGFISVFSFQ